MSALVIQTITDHLDSERPSPVADPNRWLADEDWATGFEYTGGVR